MAPQRRTRRHAPVVLAMSALIALVAVSACSGNGATVVRTEPAAAVRAAATKTAAATTVHITMDETVSGPVHVTIHLTGVSDQAAKRSQITLETGNQTVEEIIDGTTFYVRLGGAGKWTQVDLDPSIVQKAESQFNPSQGQLALLQKLGADVQQVGGNVMTDGATTTHYAGALDWRKLFATLGAGGIVPQDAANELASEVADGNGSVDVYIDEQGRVRETVMTMSLTAEGQELHVRSVGHFDDYDQPVNITVPAASDVASVQHATDVEDFAMIIAGLARGSSGVPS